MPRPKRPKRPTGRPPTDEVLAALHLVKRGMRVVEAARLCGATQQAVTNARTRAGVDSRYQPQRRHKIVADFRRGMKARDVAERYGVSMGTVYAYAHRYGRKLTERERSLRRARKGLKRP